MSGIVADLFARLTAGVHVVGVAHDNRLNAFTASSVMLTSFRPPLLALSVNPRHASYALLLHGRVFSVNVLCRDQLALAKHFGTRSGRDVDKLAGVAWRPGRTGSPIFDDAAAYFECRVVGDVDAGDHRLVLGRVIDGAVLKPDARPMTYGDTNGLDGSANLFPPSL